ncbi:MAG: HD domain-containing protein, partial [Oscillospiraceae bacterium]|nr:HD domain-containing protein [Oscillospiraceae bacterium]
FPRVSRPEDTEVKAIMNKNKRSSRIKFGSDCADLDELLNHFSSPLRSHSRRVAVCSAIMAEYADRFLQPYGLTEMNLAVSMHLGGTCHDIGKLVLPSLAFAEEDYLRHPVCGAELLGQHKDKLFMNEVQAKIVLEMVRWHHEQADGEGFPEGLTADDIPLSAAICAVANELDYLLYMEKGEAAEGVCMKNGLECDDMHDVFTDIKEQAGKKFCEKAITCFEQAWLRLAEKYTEWNRII